LQVSHCAAGVRWLTHLHAEAQRLAAGGGAGSSQGGSAAPAAAASDAKAGASERLPGDEHAGLEPGRRAAGDASPRTGAAGGAAPLPDWAAEALAHPTPAAWFRALVLRHYGHLKPPFNTEARAQAGFTPEWYVPLVAPAAAAAASAAAAAPRAKAAGGGGGGGSSGGGPPVASADAAAAPA
jgi:hypothetical protein